METRNVIHLYLGCQIEYLCYFQNKRLIGKLVGIGLDGYFFVEGDNNGQEISQAKLLLRPLSSMTEEETVEFKKLVSVDHIGFSDFKGHQTWQYWEHEEISNYESRRVCKTTSEIGALPLRCIQWLLSKHFDLFGLIEKGEAIDSTKL